MTTETTTLPAPYNPYPHLAEEGWPAGTLLKRCNAHQWERADGKDSGWAITDEKLEELRKEAQ